jgi:hypothetical protein
MPRFLITMKITAYLTVDCADEEQARAWSRRIVATLEDEDGNQIPPDAIDDFEADYCLKNDIVIELLDEE